MGGAEDCVLQIGQGQNLLAFKIEAEVNLECIESEALVKTRVQRKEPSEVSVAWGSFVGSDGEKRKDLVAFAQ